MLDAAVGGDGQFDDHLAGQCRILAQRAVVKPENFTLLLLEHAPDLVLAAHRGLALLLRRRRCGRRQGLPAGGFADAALDLRGLALRQLAGGDLAIQRVGLYTAAGASGAGGQ